MRKLNIYKYFLMLVISCSSIHASKFDPNDLPFDYNNMQHRVSNHYDLEINPYNESILEHLSTVQGILEDRQNKITEKPLGIIVGGTHTREGLLCLEMALLHLTHHYGIQTLLVEYAPKYFEEKVMKGVGHLRSKNLATEAEHLGFTVIPADLERDTQKKFLEIENPTYDDIGNHLEMVFDRDCHMAEEILTQKESFLFYVGANHLGPIYYNPELDEKFDLVFLNCSSSPYIDRQHIAYKIFEDDEICTHFQGTIDFKKETDRCYLTPVFYDKDLSQHYRKVQRATGNSSWFCKEEMHPEQEEQA